MRTQALLLIACALVGGCQETNHEKSDFGAANVARLFVTANEKCSAAGAPDLLNCAELPAPNEARTAAKTADYAYQAFVIGCHEAIGRDQCNGLMELAYAQASAAQRETTVSAQAPEPARPAAP